MSVSKFGWQWLCLFGALLTLGCGEKDSQPTQPIATPADQQGTGSDVAEDGALFSSQEAHSSAAGHFTAKIVWEDGPKVGYCSLKVILADGERKAPTTSELVNFEPWMTVHGHGGSLRKMTVAKVDGEDSAYRADQFYLTMSGPWDLKITAKVNGQEDTAVIPVEVP